MQLAPSVEREKHRELYSNIWAPVVLCFRSGEYYGSSLRLSSLALPTVFISAFFYSTGCGPAPIKLAFSLLLLSGTQYAGCLPEVRLHGHCRGRLDPYRYCQGY